MKQEKKFIGLIFALLVISLIAACSPQAQQSTQKGRAVFAITDAAADMQSVTSVKVTVESIKVHSAAEGWTTVSSSSKTYDLLELKGKSETALLADAQLKQGTYDQLRLDISKVVVTDANGTHEAKLPSGELKINGKLVVEANSTSTATFDFIADESLHVTGNGKYIMAPVVQLETREDADVSVRSGNKVQISGGKVDTNVKVGMDINGNVGVGVKISSNADISIDTLGKIKLGSQDMVSGESKGRAVFAITDAAANMESVSSVKVNVNSVKVHSESEGWVTVSSTPKTYDLLKLDAENKNELLADIQLDEGTYNQFRLDISNVVITDANGTHEAKLPSNELKLNGELRVQANSTATVVFDFVVNESLHVTGNGKYIMAPVIQLETREYASVKIKSSNKVEINGGRIKTNSKIGMDIDGNVGEGLKIREDSRLSVKGEKITEESEFDLMVG